MQAQIWPVPALVTCVKTVLLLHDRLSSLFCLKSLTRKHRSAIVRIFNLTDVDDVLGGRGPGGHDYRQPLGVVGLVRLDGKQGPGKNHSSEKVKFMDRLFCTIGGSILRTLVALLGRVLR